MSNSLNDTFFSPGAIDLQINGALGVAFNDLNADTADLLPEICRFLWQQGIDGFLPTLVTTSLEKIQTSLAIIQAAIAQQKANLAPASAEILGVHLEGPFLHPDKRGAHPKEHLLPLNLDTMKKILGDYTSIVKLITLAPELDESGEVIPFLVDLGIVVSLGHSTATTAQAKQAFDRGATSITHAFNAMPPLHHREPGLLGQALLDPRVWCCAIADGVHVHPQMLDLLVRLTGGDRNRLVLVSDALAPLGLPDGNYPWDTRKIEVKNGTARLADGTLSGTTLPLLECVKNMVKWGICAPERAIAMATITPRQLLNFPDEPLANSSSHQPASASQALVWHWDSARELVWQRQSIPV
jgi:N-acetylglucosamine-6-phosphate deacetylase